MLYQFILSCLINSCEKLIVVLNINATWMNMKLSHWVSYNSLVREWENSETRFLSDCFEIAKWDFIFPEIIEFHDCHNFLPLITPHCKRTIMDVFSDFRHVLILHSFFLSSQEGYAATRSHIAPNAIKTNCPMGSCIQIAKELRHANWSYYAASLSKVILYWSCVCFRSPVWIGLEEKKYFFSFWKFGKRNFFFIKKCFFK